MKALGRWFSPRLAVLLSLLFVIAHCDGGGCSGGCAGCESCGMTEIPGGFPASQRIENGIQIRLSSHGIGFVEANAGAIIADLMPDGLQFDVPPMCNMDATVATIDLCGQEVPDPLDPNNTICVEADYDCAVELSVEQLTLTPQDPPGNVLDVEARVNIATVDGSHIRTTGSGANCDIYIDTTDGNQDYVRIQTTVTLNVDPTSGRTSMQLGDLIIPEGDIEDADIDIDGALFSWCTAIEWFAEGILVEQITGMLDSATGPLLNSLCMSCAQGEQCPQNSSCVVEGENMFCQEDSGAGCVMPLGMEGRMDIGGLLGSIAPGKQANLDIHAWLGGYATTNDDGVSLGMHGGAMTPVHDDCVPQRDPPDLTPAPVAPSFQGNTRPMDGASFDVGIGIHKKFLDAAGYAVYDSGMLCLDVGPRETDFLVAGTFAIMIPSIYEISHDDETPIVIAIRPQNPLVFELSEQQLTQDPGTGEYTIDTPLMTITSSDFAIDFYALIDYQYARIFRINADLAVPIGLTVNGQNQLVPVIGDLEDAFQNLTVTDSDMLEEDPAVLASVFPTLIGLVAGMLGDAISPIDLPDMQGFSLIIDENGITSVEDDTMLAIYANLAYATPAPKNGLTTARTTATLVDQFTPALQDFRVTAVESFYTDKAPSVTLELGGTAPDGSDAELEWQYRFDGGLWSPFTDSSLVVLRRPVFYLQGRHHIDVRARVKGHTGTLDREPVRVDFIVDAQPPDLLVVRKGDQLVFGAHDNVSHPGDLEFSVRLDGTLWSPWQAGQNELELPAGYAGNIAVRVRDEAGNEAQRGEEVLGIYGRVTVPPASDGCVGGCQQGAGGGLAWLGFVLLGLWFARRRKRDGDAGRPGGRHLPFLVILLALSAPGMNCDCSSSPGDNSAQCPDGGIDLVCSNQDLECLDGQEVAPTEPMTLDASTCQPIPVLCECIGDVEPVDPDDFGRFLSIAARDGEVYVSSYTDRYTDLVVSTVEGTGIVPEAIDGVPPEPVTNDPDGYRGGVRARGENVGKFTSAAIADDGTVYVSYVHNTDATLKLARGLPGDWDLHVVESYADENVRPWYTALQLLGDGRPAIGYMVNGLVDPANPAARISEVRYAVASVTDPADASDWAVEVVDSTQIPCTELCNDGELCVASNWQCAPEDGSCGGCADGEGCVAGACVAILEEPPHTDHPEGLGNYVNAGLLSDGRAVLAYYDRSTGLAKLALQVGTTWAATTIEGDAESDVGYHMSMTIDDSDVIHLVYADSRDFVIYAQYDATGALLLREVADDGLRADGEYYVAGDTAIVIDGGVPTILYRDGFNNDLLIAVRNGADDWAAAPLRESTAGHGFFVDATVDTDGTVWVAEYIYDWSADELNRIEAYILQ